MYSDSEEDERDRTNRSSDSAPAAAGDDTANSTWEITAMARQIEAQLEDNSGEEEEEEKPKAVESSSSDESEEEGRPSSSASSSSERKRDEFMDQLTASAIAHEVSEMQQKQRARDADLDDSEDEGINMSSTETDGSRKSSSLSQSPIVGEERHKEGYLVWARLKGYSYWPGVVTVDPIDGATVKFGETGESKRSWTHVHFLGYENQRAWVPASGQMEFKGHDAYMAMASRVKGVKKKDFVPARRLKSLFEKACKLADDVLPLPFRQRLEKLGYVYVLVPPKSDLRTAAEKKLIPSSSVTDTATTTPKKRSSSKAKVCSIQKKFKSGESSSTNHINGRALADQSSSDDEIAPTVISSKSAKKNRPYKHKPLIAPSVKQQVRVLSPEPEEVIKDIKNDDLDEFASDSDREGNNEEPRLGSLALGRMAGFPFWPCFITKAPDGEFKRKVGKSTTYHVQFFNWNNESGWVAKALPWCSLEEFKQRAAKVSKSRPLEWKAWNPQGKGMVQKWTDAYAEAQSTSRMSRRERYDRHVVFYRSQGLVDASMYVPVAAVSMKKRGRKHRRSEDGADDPEEEDKRRHRRVSQSKRVRKPGGPLCKQKKKQNYSILLSAGELPPGWTLREQSSGKQEFQSPEGDIFQDFRDIVKHLFLQNVGPQNRRRSYSASRCIANHPGWLLEASDLLRYKTEDQMTLAAGNLDGHISYIRDYSLPAKWTVKKVRGRVKTETLYLSPEDDILSSKFEVANYIETKGHPSNELEQLMSLTAVKCSQKMQVKKEYYTINLLKCTAEEFLKHPVLAKTVSACYVEVVKLPDVFLAHPSVAVRENANEMVISDLATGEFIAKKIIYD